MTDEPPEDRRNGPPESGPRDAPDGQGEAPDGERSAREAPLGDLAERIRRRQSGEGDGSGGAPDRGEGGGREDGPFVRTDAFDPTASERLWQSIEKPATPATAELAEAPDERVVSKRAYCESCEHFGDPPAVHCTHPGTSIVGFPDAEHVRVRDCPVVAERRATGEAREPGRRPGPFDRQ